VVYIVYCALHSGGKAFYSLAVLGLYTPNTVSGVIPAVAYIRVSTEEQNPENQRLYLEAWAARHSLAILKYYVDVGEGGDTPPWERPAFRQLIREVRVMDPRPKVLLVYETSRLVRSFQELFQLLDLVENKLGLVVVSASERENVLLYFDGVYRQFLRAVLAFVAHLELEFTRARTKVGLARARVRGKVSNIAERRPDLVKAVAEYYTRSGSLRETARTFGLSLYEVRRLLVAAGVYKPPEGTCPRCFAKLRVVDRGVKIEEGKYVVVERLRCSNCGYETIEAKAR